MSEISQIQVGETTYNLAGGTKVVTAQGNTSIQAVPVSPYSNGEARGNGAVDLQIQRYTYDKVAKGDYSIIAGCNNRAKGECSAAFNSYNKALSRCSTVFGEKNKALSPYSVVTGSGNSTAIKGAITNNYDRISYPTANNLYGHAGFLGLKSFVPEAEVLNLSNTDSLIARIDVVCSPDNILISFFVTVQNSEVTSCTMSGTVDGFSSSDVYMNNGKLIVNTRSTYEKQIGIFYTLYSDINAASSSSSGSSSSSSSMEESV